MALALAAAAACFPASALAFEREWHLGGGAGAALPPGDYELGPVLGLHAAYGISDVFDVRAELAGGRHALDGGETITLLSGVAGLAYKIDIIQWVPYVGVLAGYYGTTDTPAPDQDLTEGSPSLGFIVGIDYAVSRQFGLGLALRDDFLLDEGGNYGQLALRAEYRFGW